MQFLVYLVTPLKYSLIGKFYFLLLDYFEREQNFMFSTKTFLSPFSMFKDNGNVLNKLHDVHYVISALLVPHKKTTVS